MEHTIGIDSVPVYGDDAVNHAIFHIKTDFKYKLYTLMSQSLFSEYFVGCWKSEFNSPEWSWKVSFIFAVSVLFNIVTILSKCIIDHLASSDAVRQ